jgi:NTP pyrophosphatase (non-canonical NTP hydrolase)
MQPGVGQYLPFGWRNNFDDARLHSMLVNLVDEALEVAELIHSLDGL